MLRLVDGSNDVEDGSDAKGGEEPSPQVRLPGQIFLAAGRGQLRSVVSWLGETGRGVEAELPRAGKDVVLCARGAPLYGTKIEVPIAAQPEIGVALLERLAQPRCGKALRHIAGDVQAADLLTKPLERKRFVALRRYLMNADAMVEAPVEGQAEGRARHLTRAKHADGYESLGAASRGGGTNFTVD